MAESNDEKSTNNPSTEGVAAQLPLEQIVKGNTGFATKDIQKDLVWRRYDPHQTLPKQVIPSMAIAAHRSGQLLAEVKNNPDANKLEQAVNSATAAVAATQSNSLAQELSPVKNEATQVLTEQGEIKTATIKYNNELTNKLSSTPKEHQDGKPKKEIISELKTKTAECNTLFTKVTKAKERMIYLTEKLEGIKHKAINSLSAADKKRFESPDQEQRTAPE